MNARTVFVCVGTFKECWNCAGPLLRGGFLGEGRFCDEQCMAEHQRHHLILERRHHLWLRDLMCDCEICTANGHPTTEERADWDAHVAAFRSHPSEITKRGER